MRKIFCRRMIEGQKAREEVQALLKFIFSIYVKEFF